MVFFELLKLDNFLGSVRVRVDDLVHGELEADVFGSQVGVFSPIIALIPDRDVRVGMLDGALM